MRKENKVQNRSLAFYAQRGTRNELRKLKQNEMK